MKINVGVFLRSIYNRYQLSNQSKLYASPNTCPEVHMDKRPDAAELPTAWSP